MSKNSLAVIPLIMLCLPVLACAEADVANEQDSTAPQGGIGESTQTVVSTNGCTGAAIVAVNTSDNNLYRWTRALPYSGGFSSAAKVGTSWQSIRLLASDAGTGDLFAVHENGKLFLYSYKGTGYTGGNEIGHGWENMRQLIPAGDGILYAIANDGSLYWYRWTSEGWMTNSGAAAIGSGWSGLTVFSGGNGILYAIVQSTGELRWYRHLDPFGGTSSWLGPRTIGSGWQSMRWAVGLGSGIIYAVNTAGALLYYENTGYADGSAVWLNGGKAQTIGSGWTSYRSLTANSNACATEPAGSATHLWTDCVPFYGSGLRGKSFTDHGQTVAVDAVGRPWYAEKTWASHVTPSNGGRDESCQGEVAGWGMPGDQGGHLIPAALGGWPGRANLVPQNGGKGGMNGSVWRVIENALARCVGGDYQIQYGVTATYPDIDNPRPTQLGATLFVIAGDQEYVQTATLANRAPTSNEQQQANAFANSVFPMCRTADKQFTDSSVNPALAADYWGDVYEPSVEYTNDLEQVRVHAGGGHPYAVRLERCSNNCDAVTDTNFSVVPESVTVLHDNGPSLWIPVLHFSQYRACVQITSATAWKCMLHAKDLSNTH